MNRSGAQRNKNVGAIVGETLGGVALFGILVGLVIVFHRRRQQTDIKRWSFHRDKMVLPPVLDIRPLSPMNTHFISPDDVEQGLPQDDIPTSPIVFASPSGPKPLPKPVNRPLPIPPVPLKPRQEDIVEQMEQGTR